MELALEQYNELKQQVINLRISCNEEPTKEKWEKLRKLETALSFCTIKYPETNQKNIENKIDEIHENDEYIQKR